MKFVGELCGAVIERQRKKGYEDGGQGVDVKKERQMM
jgi:hypothetical protein